MGCAKELAVDGVAVDGVAANGFVLVMGVAAD
jgi:hypothetical protein